MATNPFFRQLYQTNDTADQALAEDLIIEMIQIHGTDFYYLPRTLENFDKFFGEDTKISSFKEAYTLEFYPETIKGFEGQGSILTKFGLEDLYDGLLVCSIKRFEEEITANDPDIIRPREGDVIVYPKSLDNAERFFEIMSVENEELFYQLGKLYVYKMRVKTFEYSGERVETGLDQLDDYGHQNLVGTEILLQSAPDLFTPGSVITQSSGWSATVVSHVGDIIVVGRQKGVFDELLDITDGIVIRTPIQVTDPVVLADGLPDNKQLEELDDNSDSLIVQVNNPFLE